MTPQKYLEDKLKTCSLYDLTEDDKKFIEDNSLKEFLFKQITRKKFRRWKLPDPARARIEEALEFCLSQEKPLVFRFGFGGYKLWRFSSAPEVDWAEFFSVAYYSQYLAPIIAAYNPGVRMIFSSYDVFVERLDNIPKSDTEAYYSSFQKLLDQFRKHFSDNFEMDILRHPSLYKSETALEAEFANEVNKVKDSWKEDRDEAALKRNLATSEMNIKWDGAEDLTKLSGAEKQQRIEQGVMYHDALMNMPTLRAWSDAKDKIALFSTSFPNIVAIGTTKTSIVRFWVGTGILEKHGDSYNDRVLSIKQLESSKDLKYDEVETDLVPLKNFRTVRIYNERFEFANK